MSKTNQVKEDTKSVFQNKRSRRTFLKYSGAGIATAGILLMGCEDKENMVPDLDGVVNLGSGDVGVLNYAYVLEQLEAAFYINVVTNLYRNISDAERTMMEDLRNHEVAHRGFAISRSGQQCHWYTFDFSSVNFNNRDSVLATAKVFEDLGVAAYNGVGKLLQNPDFLLIAGKIVKVEARHAAAIRSIFDSDFAGNDVIDANGMDRAFEPAMVLNAASTFILNKINASQLPTS